MKFLLVILSYLVVSINVHSQSYPSNLMCTLNDNNFKVTYYENSWNKEITMWPWSVQQLECGRNTAAVLVDNNFLFFSLKNKRISTIKLQTFDNENVYLKVGDDVAALVVDNYLRVDSSKSTYEQYFDSLAENVLLLINKDMTGLIYGSDFVVVVQGYHYQLKFDSAASSSDKLLTANYGFAVKRGNKFLVFDKYRLSFKSITLKVTGKLQTIYRVPTYILSNGVKVTYNSSTGNFDQN